MTRNNKIHVKNIIKWGKLPDQIIVRILQMAESPFERLQWSKISKKWYKSSLQGELYLWVDCESDSSHWLNCESTSKIKSLDKNDLYLKNEWMTIGSHIEALYADGEVWYPGIINAANSDGSYDVIYYDGFIEYGLRRSMLRLDRGSRYNFVTPSDGSNPYGTFNKFHQKRLTLGPLAPIPKKFLNLKDALKFAKDGDVIILRAGLHHISCNRYKNNDNYTFLINKKVKILSEEALAKQNKIDLYIKKLVKGEFDNNGYTGPANKLHHHYHHKKSETASIISKASSLSRIKKGKLVGGTYTPLPPPHVEMLGIEAASFDHIKSRQNHRMYEESRCSSLEKLVKSPVSNAMTMEKQQDDNEEKQKVIMWTYKQQTCIELRKNEKIEIVNDVVFNGIVISHNCNENDKKSKIDHSQKKEKGENGILISNGSLIQFHDCTLSHLHGCGSNVILDGKKSKPLLFMTDTLLCSAPQNGLLVLNGMGAIFLDCEVCGNGGAGIAFNGDKPFVLIAKRTEIFGNENVLNISKIAKIGALFQHCNFRGNKYHGEEKNILVPKGFPSEQNLIFDDVLFSETDEFKFNKHVEQFDDNTKNENALEIKDKNNANINRKRKIKTESPISNSSSKKKLKNF